MLMEKPSASIARMAPASASAASNAAIAAVFRGFLAAAKSKRSVSIGMNPRPLGLGLQRHERAPQLAAQPHPGTFVLGLASPEHVKQ